MPEFGGHRDDPGISIAIPHNSLEYLTPRPQSAQWPELHPLVPMTPMKDHKQLLCQEEKKSIKAKPRGDESEEEFGAEHFAQLATDILTRCMDARDYEPIKVQNQIRDLALSYARLVPCRTVLSPTNPRPTAPME